MDLLNTQYREPVRISDLTEKKKQYDIFSNISRHLRNILCTLIPMLDPILSFFDRDQYIVTDFAFPSL